MKLRLRQQIHKWMPGTAEFVMAHAAWQRTHGRPLAAPYAFVRNPRLALMVASVVALFKRFRNVHPDTVWNSLWEIKPGVLQADVDVWARIDVVVEMTAELASCLASLIMFEFNTVTVLVEGDSDPEFICRDYHRAISGYIDKYVGPYPSAILTEEEVANDARIEAERRKQRRLQEAALEAQRAARYQAIHAKLADAPLMEPSDEEGWAQLMGGQGLAWGRLASIRGNEFATNVLEFVQGWTRLMQLEMARGMRIAEVAKATFDEADVVGYSGYSAGVAVGLACKYWKYGNALRAWWDDYHQSDEEAQAG